MSSRSTMTVGLIVSVLIIAAVGSIGYYQFVVAPGLNTTSTTTTPTQVSCTPTTCVNVTIPQGASTQGPGYGPDSITLVIGKNNTVVWTNDDNAIHTMTATDQSFDSLNIVAGEVWQYTFTVPGTYTYICIYHPVMRGTVTVKSA